MAENLPSSRSITIATGDPIPAALINELQDNIIDGSYKTRKSHSLPVNPGSAWSGPTSGFGGLPILSSNGTGTAAMVPMPDCPDGSILETVDLIATGNGVADAVINVYVVDAAFTRTTIGTLTITNPPASLANFSVPVTDTMVPAGGFVFADISANASGFGVSMVTYGHRR